MERTTLYLGGPMTGIPQFNFPAFDQAAGRLRAEGFDVVSPAELDDPKTREAALASADGALGSGAANGETWGDFLSRDVKLIADKVDGAVFLDDWETSRGARLEALVCKLEDKPVFRYAPTEKGGVALLDEETVGRAIAGSLLRHASANGNGEVRVKDATTGGEKGQKIARFDLIPADFERQLALVYGAGSTKYDDDNWRKGYAWRLSLGAMRRHLCAWQTGESFDPELSELAGEPVNHLACVAWHAATLLTFETEGLGTDNIPERAGREDVPPAKVEYVDSFVAAALKPFVKESGE